MAYRSRLVTVSALVAAGAVMAALWPRGSAGPESLAAADYAAARNAHIASLPLPANLMPRHLAFAGERDVVLADQTNPNLYVTGGGLRSVGQLPVSEPAESAKYSVTSLTGGPDSSWSALDMRGSRVRVFHGRQLETQFRVAGHPLTELLGWRGDTLVAVGTTAFNKRGEAELRHIGRTGQDLVPPVQVTARDTSLVVPFTGTLAFIGESRILTGALLGRDVLLANVQRHRVSLYQRVPFTSLARATASRSLPSPGPLQTWQYAIDSVETATAWRQYGVPQKIAAYLDSMQRRASQPYLHAGSLVPDGQGRVWVLTTQPVLQGTLVQVLDRQGDLLTALRLPGYVRGLAFRGDRMVALRSGLCTVRTRCDTLDVFSADKLIRAALPSAAGRTPGWEAASGARVGARATLSDLAARP